MNRLLLSFAFLIYTSICFVYAQGPVIVNITLTPPYSPYIQDYTNFNGTFGNVFNTTQSQLRVYIKGKIEGDNGYFVRTKPDFKPLQPNLLTVGTTSLTKANIKQFHFFNQENLETNASNQQIQNIAQDGVLPEGNYTFCVQVFNFDTDLPLSETEPLGCASFSISYVQPPQIIQPTCGEPLAGGSSIFAPTMLFPNFLWTPAVGNTAGANIRYDWWLVKLVPGQEPNEAMQSAINYNAGIFLKKTDLTTPNYLYKPSDPALPKGFTYAWRVRAKDLNNKVFFENGGLSEVCTFSVPSSITVTPHDSTVVTNPIVPIPIVVTPTSPPSLPPGTTVKSLSACTTCTGGRPSNQTANTNPSVAKGNTVIVAGFEMIITDIAISGGKLTGKGMIPFPLLNTDWFKLRVEFTGITINTDPIPHMIAGQVKAIRNKDGDPAYIPALDGLQSQGPNIGAHAITQLFTGNNVGNLLESAASSSLALTGFNVPFGSKVGPDALGQVLAFDNFTFTDKEARYDAYFKFSLQGDNAVAAGPTGALALKAIGVCFSKDNIFCGGADFLLTEDFTIHLSDGGTGNNLRLKGGASVSPGVSADNPTHIKLTRVGGETHVTFNISAEYEFNQDVLIGVKEDGTETTAKIRISCDNGISWDNWIASITMNPFKIKGADDFIFNGTTGIQGYYDHSSTRNPEEFSDELKSKYTECGHNQFQGFYLTKFDLGLPQLIRSIDGAKKTAIGIKDLLIQNNGQVSVEILVTNIATLETGRMDTWGFAVDALSCKFRRNTFSAASIIGKIQLPISAKNPKDDSNVAAYLTYSGIFSHNSTKKVFDFTFSVKPEKNIDVSIWYAHMELLNTSKIELGYVNEKLVANACLNGRFFMKGDKDTPFIGDKEFANFNFEQFQLVSKSPVIKKDDAKPMKTKPPQTKETKVAGGFPLFIDKIEPSLSDLTKPGLAFWGGIRLSTIASALPTISAHFIIKCPLTFDPCCSIGTPSFDIDQLCLGDPNNAADKGATLGPFSIKGCIGFYHGDQTYGDGFSAEVTAEVVKTFKIQMYMRAGNMKEANGETFDYFGLDALATFNPGIPFFPGTSLYGFGGGGWNNMNGASFGVPTLTYKDGEPNMTSATTPKNFFVPMKSSWGMKATVVFGLSEKTAFNATITLSMGEQSFDYNTGKPSSTGNVKSFYISLDGKAQIISSAFITNSDGLASGEIHASYVAELKLFTASAGIVFLCPKDDPIIVAGTATTSADATGFDIYFRGDRPLEWHIRIGRPQNPVGVKLLNPLTKDPMFNLAAYFEVGNHEIDPMPAPPQRILEIFAKAGMNNVYTESGVLENASSTYQSLGVSNRSQSADSYDFRMITGARFETAMVVNPFGIAVVITYAGIGFDLKLQHYTKSCDALPIGANGWYLNGQVYAGIEMEICGGLGIDNSCIGIPLASAGLAALAEFGGPNPTWVKGNIAGYVKILEWFDPFDWGYTNVHFGCSFSAGEARQCLPGRTFEGTALINQMYPPEYEADKNPMQELTFLPRVDFQTKIGSDFWFEEIQEGSGAKTKRHFRLYKEDIRVFLQKRNTKNGGLDLIATVNDFELINEVGSPSSLRLKANSLLTPNSYYAFQVVATLMEEVSPNNWQPAKNKTNGSIIKEQKDVAFKTKEGFDKITDEMVEWTIPFNREGYFNYKSYFPKARIKLAGRMAGLTANSFNVQGNNPKMKARWIPLGGSNTHTPLSSPCTIENGILAFNMPHELLSNTYYVAQVYVETDHAAESNTLPTGSLGSYIKGGKVINGNGTTAPLPGPTMESAFAMKPWQKNIYEIRFKTSRFTSPQEKLSAATLDHIKLSMQLISNQGMNTQGLFSVQEEFNKLGNKVNRTSAEQEMYDALNKVISSQVLQDYYIHHSLNIVQRSLQSSQASSQAPSAVSSVGVSGATPVGNAPSADYLMSPNNYYILPGGAKPYMEICEEMSGLTKLKSLLGSVNPGLEVYVSEVKRVSYRNLEPYDVRDFGEADDDSGGAILFDGATCYQETQFLSNNLVFSNSKRSTQINDILKLALHTNNVDSRINQVATSFNIFSTLPIQPEDIWATPILSTGYKRVFDMKLNRQVGINPNNDVAHQVGQIMNDLLAPGDPVIHFENNLSIYQSLAIAYDQIYTFLASTPPSGIQLGAGMFQLPTYPGVNASLKIKN